MAGIIDEVEFLIQMYKKSKDKKKFLAVMQQLSGAGDISPTATDIMGKLVQAETAPARPKRVAPPASDGCSGGIMSRSTSC